MKTLLEGSYRNIIVLTGAGISVASGLPTFRGAGGLWTDKEAVKASSREVVRSDPAQAWAFWNRMKRAAQIAVPNAAHRALVAWERALPASSSLLVITQNIDGLHQRAGSSHVLEVHGSLFRARCSQETCTAEVLDDTPAHRRAAFPVCDACGAALRPDVTMFGEALDPEVEWRTKRALRDCDLFIAVGTSGTVAPASGYVRSADFAGARTLFVNTERLAPPNPYFHASHLGRAEEILPRLIGVAV